MMKQFLGVAALILFFGSIGCNLIPHGGGDGTAVPIFPTAIPGPVVEPIRTSGNASLQFEFVLPGGESAKASLRALTEADIRVLVSLRLLNVDHPEQPFTVLTKTTTVKNGVATVTFSGLPPLSTVGEIVLENGWIGSYSQFHGAVDLVDNATSVLQVAPKGSTEAPAFLGRPW